MAKPVTPVEHLAAARDEVRKMRDLESDAKINLQLDTAINSIERAIVLMNDRHDAAMRAAYGPKGE